MGDLYTQHYPTQHHHFDITYEGDIAEINTKPLFAALIRGLTKSVSETQVNIVNATLVAKDRGIIVNEHHSRERSQAGTYSSLITLKSRDNQLISGFVSDDNPRIVRLDRFTTSFVPEGYLLICHNYDRPGMIGKVGGVLGMNGVNISYMSVAPLVGNAVCRAGEALMILGVDRKVGEGVLKDIEKTDGIVDVKMVHL
jgi:D-3-phosphoglycerate dehydrogenase